MTLRLRIAGVGLALLAAALPCAGQQRYSDVEQDCDVNAIRTLERIKPDWQAVHPDSVAALLVPDVRAQAWSRAMATAMAKAELAVGFAPENDSRARYERRLESLESAVRRYLELPVDRQAHFFADSVRPADFLLRELNGTFPIFAGTPDEIIVAASMSRDERRAYCWPTIVLRRVLVAMGSRRRAQTVAALDALARRWDDYVKNGYSQLPWELFVNGHALHRGDYEPPSQQWILLHPSVGVEALGTHIDQLKRVDVALLEGLGWIHYFDGGRRYVGVSAVASFAPNANVAAGPFVHLWWPQMKVGYVFRTDADPARRRSVLASVDLYNLLTGVPDDIAAARNTALGKKLMALAP